MTVDRKAKTSPSAYKVYRYILDKLTSRILFPGMQIVEADLEKEIGISRTPIRAAIQRLHYEGLVDIIPYKGAFIAQPTYEEITNAYQCKNLLEAEAVRLACFYITDEELNRLDELLQQEKMLHNQQKVHDFYRMNQEFHMIIAKASRNPFLVKYINELINKCNVYLIFYDNLVSPAHVSPTYKEHARILEAMKKRDSNAAVTAIKRHNLITLNELDIPNHTSKKDS